MEGMGSIQPSAISHRFGPLPFGLALTLGRLGVGVSGQLGLKGRDQIESNRRSEDRPDGDGGGGQ